MDNTWIKIIADNAPPPRSGHCCALLDNDFYVFGGLNQTEVMNDLYQFNLIEKVNSIYISRNGSKLKILIILLLVVQLNYVLLQKIRNYISLVVQH